MTKMEYAKKIAELVNGEVKEVDKANGVKLIGICIKDDNTNIYPNIYIEKMYNEGLNIEEAAKIVKEISEERKMNELDLDYLHDFENVKHMIKARLYNNLTKAEVYRKAPEPFNDLIIIPYIEGIIKNGACKVNKAMIDKWNMTEEEILNIAEENSKNDYEIKSLMSVMLGEDLPFPEIEEPRIFIVTNQNKQFGAYAVIPAIEDLKLIFKNGFNVIPSSIHETLIVDPSDEEIINQMINDVNSEHVDLEDQLSDHTYRITK